MDIQKIKLIVLKIVAYAINAIIILAIIGVVVFYIWGLIESAMT